MKIIGCDFHTRQQQIEMLDTETERSCSCDWNTTTGKPDGFTSSCVDR